MIDVWHDVIGLWCGYLVRRGCRPLLADIDIEPLSSARRHTFLDLQRTWPACTTTCSCFRSGSRVVSVSSRPGRGRPSRRRRADRSRVAAVSSFPCRRRRRTDAIGTSSNPSVDRCPSAAICRHPRWVRGAVKRRRGMHDHHQPCLWPHWSASHADAVSAALEQADATDAEKYWVEFAIARGK